MGKIEHRVLIGAGILAATGLVYLIYMHEQSVAAANASANAANTASQEQQDALAEEQLAAQYQDYGGGSSLSSSGGDSATTTYDAPISSAPQDTALQNLLQQYINTLTSSSSASTSTNSAATATQTTSNAATTTQTTSNSATPIVSSAETAAINAYNTQQAAYLATVGTVQPLGNGVPLSPPQDPTVAVNPPVNSASFLTASELASGIVQNATYQATSAGSTAIAKPINTSPVPVSTITAPVTTTQPYVPVTTTAGTSTTVSGTTTSTAPRPTAPSGSTAIRRLTTGLFGNSSS